MIKSRAAARCAIQIVLRIAALIACALLLPAFARADESEIEYDTQTGYIRAAASPGEDVLLITQPGLEPRFITVKYQ